MKKVQIIQTESGELLTNPGDGFVVIGAIFKGDGEGGLIGDAEIRSALESLEIEPTAYTNDELLDALHLPIAVFERYIESRKAQIRKDTYL